MLKRIAAHEANAEASGLTSQLTEILECATDRVLDGESRRWGHLAALQFILSYHVTSLELAGRLLSDAAHRGHLEIMLLLHGSYCQLLGVSILAHTNSSRVALGNAVEGDHLAMIEFLSRHGYHHDRRFVFRAEVAKAIGEPERRRWEYRSYR